jgi:hypothetical protein
MSYNTVNTLQNSSIFIKGKYIGVRIYYNYTINLYLLDDIFYEVWYSPESNEIEKIDKLDDEKKLDLYIQHMNQLDKHLK